MTTKPKPKPQKVAEGFIELTCDTSKFMKAMQAARREVRALTTELRTLKTAARDVLESAR